MRRDAPTAPRQTDNPTTNNACKGLSVMSEPQGAHGEAGATSASTDATLNARVKTPHRRPWIWIVVAAVAVVAIVAGVIVGVTRPAGQADGEASDTVTIGLKLAPTNLDIRNQSGSALDQVLIGNVYEGLVTRDENNDVVASLAESWDVSDDGLVYTFHLNEGMTFSNGDVLDAEDVVWSIQDLVDNQYHDSDSLTNFESIDAVDANTVEITLSAPNANLLWALSGRCGLVLDADADYDMQTEAIGSGPYLVSDFRANESITLTANPDYWGDHAAQTETVILRYYTDDNAAVNALASGDVQVLAPISDSLADQFRDDDSYTVQAGDGTDKYVLAFNSAGEYTSDIRVRQAIRMGINHDELIASRGDVDAALGGPIPSLDPGYEDLTDLYPYDPDQARELMAEVGYSPDNPLTLRLEYSNTYGTELGDQLRSQLLEIGIDLEVDVVEFSTWLQDVYTNKDYDLSLVDHNESHDFSQWADPDYYYNYDNAEVQSLYEQALASTSDEEYERLLAQAARIVSEDAAADWLFNYRITTAWVNGVDGFPVNLNQTQLPLWNVTYTAA